MHRIRRGELPGRRRAWAPGAGFGVRTEYIPCIRRVESSDCYHMHTSKPRPSFFSPRWRSAPYVSARRTILISVPTPVSASAGRNEAFASLSLAAITSTTKPNRQCPHTRYFTARSTLFEDCRARAQRHVSRLPSASPYKGHRSRHDRHAKDVGGEW